MDMNLSTTTSRETAGSDYTGPGSWESFCVADMNTPRKIFVALLAVAILRHCLDPLG